MPPLSPIQLAESVRRIERARTMRWRRARRGKSTAREERKGKRASERKGHLRPLDREVGQEHEAEQVHERLVIFTRHAENSLYFAHAITHGVGVLVQLVGDRLHITVPVDKRLGRANEFGAVPPS